MIIKEVRARSIKDSRGQPTIEVAVNRQKASAPSGKSIGTHETPAYHRSLRWNINAVNTTELPFEISSFSDLAKVESFLQKRFKLKQAQDFGANTLFALESAILKALANHQKKELWQVVNSQAKKLPIPAGNAIGGGVHSTAFPYHTAFQEFLLIPQEDSFAKNVKLMRQVYQQLQTFAKAKKVNDEGAWQTSLDEETILRILSKCKKICIGIDVAASAFYKGGKYCYQDKTLSPEEQSDYLTHVQKTYNLFYLEDPFHEEDFSHFSKLPRSHSRLIAGDDLTATHLKRIKKAVKTKAINAVIIKPNQNGSLLALQEIFAFCKKNGIKTIFSHRSGETLDTAIADYAFAFQADFIKCGIATPWRECKLNRLIEIEKSLRKS